MKIATSCSSKICNWTRVTSTSSLLRPEARDNTNAPTSRLARERRPYGDDVEVVPTSYPQLITPINHPLAMPRLLFTQPLTSCADMSQLPRAEDYRKADHPIESLFLRRWSPRAMNGEAIA